MAVAFWEIGKNTKEGKKETKRPPGSPRPLGEGKRRQGERHERKVSNKGGKERNEGGTREEGGWHAAAEGF